jgi:hypothetical protein
MWQARQEYRQGIRQVHALYQRGLDLYFLQSLLVAVLGLFGANPKFFFNSLLLYCIESALSHWR